jgi:mevalonate kinase
VQNIKKLQKGSKSNRRGDNIMVGELMTENQRILDKIGYLSNRIESLIYVQDMVLLDPR